MSGGWGIPTDIAVSYPGTRHPAQTLRLENDQRAYRGADLVIGQDLNDDGWTDLLAETFSGTGGQSYDIFMWNPRRHRFEQDSVMRGGANVLVVEGRNCVQSTNRSGVGTYYGTEFCWRGGRWHRVRRWRWEAQTIPEGDPVTAILTTEEMRFTTVTRVRVDTVHTTVYEPPEPPAGR